MPGKDFKVARLASSRRISRVLKNFHLIPKKSRIDLMVEARLITPEQPEKATRKWDETQLVR